jgi:8-amino-7-oxononanoate synthase
MGLFDKFKPLLKEYEQVNAAGHNPFKVNVEKVMSPTEAVVNGRPTIMAGTNNYLGLTFDPTCIDAAIDALRREGTGTTGSRVANGSYEEHRRLEQELAAFFGRRSAMVFSTGHHANLGILSTLAGPHDHLVIDADSHASIYDGCKLSSAQVTRFRHNNAADLDKRLARLASQPGDKIVVVEGIYSMLGDRAPLKEIVEVAKRHGAYIILDEAHSLGVLGRHGRGLAEEAEVEDDIDFIVGTFSKSLGAVGGFIVSNNPDFDVMRVACRTYKFTASLPPSVMASVSAALGVLRKKPELRLRLKANSTLLYDGMRRLGFKVGPEVSPVVAVHLPNLEVAVRFWNMLLESGIYVNLAPAHATPNGVSLLRCSVCAAHSREQRERILDVFQAIGTELGLLEEQRLAVAQ